VRVGILAAFLKDPERGLIGFDSTLKHIERRSNAILYLVLGFTRSYDLSDRTKPER
jgi:hypothetical protein